MLTFARSLSGFAEDNSKPGWDNPTVTELLLNLMLSWPKPPPPDLSSPRSRAGNRVFRGIVRACLRIGSQFLLPNKWRIGSRALAAQSLALQVLLLEAALPAPARLLYKRSQAEWTRCGMTWILALVPGTISQSLFGRAFVHYFPWFRRSKLTSRVKRLKKTQIQTRGRQRRRSCGRLSIVQIKSLAN